MTWTATSKTTKHTCGGPVFGRKTPGCPRCDELIAGAQPIVWTTHASSQRGVWDKRQHSCRCGVYIAGRYTGGICCCGDW